MVPCSCFARTGDVVVDWHDGDRASLAPLFALAGDSAHEATRARDRGRVLVAKDGDAIVGYAQLLPDRTGGEAELKSLAVAEERQGEGIGRCLVRQAIASCRAAEYARLVVEITAAERGPLRFYQGAGFRLSQVERGGRARLSIDL
jgi:ribosomal protein S18 acetylase RimI-like enzyme